MALFTRAVRTENASLVRIGAWITVFGIIFNRLNTALVCFNYKMYQEIPHWKELWLTLTLYALYFIIYRFIVYRLPIVFNWEEQKTGRQPLRNSMQQ